MVLASALLAACGGSSRSLLSKAQAEAFANAVNLRATDVPGIPQWASTLNNKAEPPFADCTTHITHFEEILSAKSARFRRAREKPRSAVLIERPPIEAVRSAVYVMRESSTASRYTAAMRSPGTAACVQRTLIKDSSERLLEHETPYRREIHVTQLPLLLPRGANGYGLRVTGTLAGAVYHMKGRQKFYEDTFAFAVGPVEVVLYAVGVGRPFPTEEERHLLFVLYGRAVTQTRLAADFPRPPYFLLRSLRAVTSNTLRLEVLGAASPR